MELLDQRNIQVSSVDFVRFTWLNEDMRKYQHIKKRHMSDSPSDKDSSMYDDASINVEDTLNEDEGYLNLIDNQDILYDNEDMYFSDDDDDDDDTDSEDFHSNFPLSQRHEDGTRYYTNPTIWIGVLPDTLTTATAYESSMDIVTFLDSLHVQNVDIAYRESVYRTMSGPPLFRPARNSLRRVIDNVSVALSIPIADGMTGAQGTLGPYFHASDKLYAITSRHIFFDVNKDDQSYKYNGMFKFDALDHFRSF